MTSVISQAIRTVPALPTAEAVTFGALKLMFTDIFDYRWSDIGSGGDYDVGFYKPHPPADGFRSLGSIGIKGYDNPNNQQWALCISASESDPDAVREPIRYDWVWNDDGSGADNDGACWRPVAPEGYVALGDVFVSTHDSEPSKEDVWCVRADLVGDGIIDEWIWDDAGTGSNDDFSAWSISPMNVFISETQILIAPNTFFGCQSHDRPAAAVKVLKLNPPTENAAIPPVPSLPSRARPESQSTQVWDRKVTLPFTAIVDNQHDLAWKVAYSPFYVLERWVNFELAAFEDNGSEVPHEIEVKVEAGVSKQQTDTFTHEVGISVSYESGIKAGPVSTKVSGTLSYKFGYQTATQIGSFRSEAITTKLTTPAQHSAAMWAPRHAFQLVRRDGSKVSEPLVLDDNVPDFYVRQFPAPARSKPLRVRAR